MEVKAKRGDCKLEDSRYNAAMPDNFDPNLIQDPVLCQAVLFLMNQVEELSAKVKSQAEEIQRLQDENNRLKGEQGKPQIRPNLEPKTISSE